MLIRPSQSVSLATKEINYTDREIIRMLKAGDSRAFDELYYHYIPRIVSFAGTFIKDGHQCEEIVQDVN
jgi:RNA polymerase sigma-70 factor (ECF subfamily)